MNSYIKAFFAGVLIGLAGLANLLAPDKIIGACFFSIGLIAVIILQANLYTGKVGFATFDNWKHLPPMLFDNLMGAWVVGQMSLPLCYEQAFQAQSLKYATSLHELLVRAFFCGIYVYLAVVLYRRKENVILIALPVIIFVASGFNHCIAEMFYMSVSGMYDWVRLLICVFGNSLGAIAINSLASD